MKSILLFYILVLTIQSDTSPYHINKIDSALLQNADVVIREDHKEVHIESVYKMTVTHEMVKTILKQESGQIHLPFQHGPSHKIKSLNAQILDKNGKELKRLKKKDFMDVSATSDGTLHSDERMLVYSYTPASYPITISYQVTTETKSTAFIPSWRPVSGFKTSVESSSYKLTYKPKVKVKFKKYNIEDNEHINSKKITSGIIYNASFIPATKKEPLAPQWDKICPKVSFALRMFNLEGSIASNENWNEFGKWMYNDLLKNQGKLTNNVKYEITKLTEGLISEEDKARAIHKYVQDRSRYISVQLGIGGWEPIDAQSVHNSGYGDCKGLTNYTKALMDLAGIRSYYTIVYAGHEKQDFDDELSKMEGTHVILCLPNLTSTDTTWLECTNAITPFGYIEGFTDDRRVLVVTPEGGRLATTTKYTYEDNININTHHISIDIYSDAALSSKSVKRGSFYNDQYYLTQYEDDLSGYYRDRWNILNNLKLHDANHSKNEIEVEIIEHIEGSSESYGTIAGDEMIIPIHQLDAKLRSMPRSRNRKLDLVVSNGFTQSDTSFILIPEDTRVSKLPENVVVNEDFGSYALQLEKLADSEIKVTRTLIIKEGQYPPSTYQKYRAFIKDVNAYDKAKLIITNKT